MSIDFSDLDPLKQTLPPTSNGTPSRNGVYEEESSTFSLMNETGSMQERNSTDSDDRFAVNESAMSLEAQLFGSSPAQKPAQKKPMSPAVASLRNEDQSPLSGKSPSKLEDAAGKVREFFKFKGLRNKIGRRESTASDSVDSLLFRTPEAMSPVTAASPSESKSDMAGDPQSSGKKKPSSDRPMMTGFRQRMNSIVDRTNQGFDNAVGKTVAQSKRFGGAMKRGLQKTFSRKNGGREADTVSVDGSETSMITAKGFDFLTKLRKRLTIKRTPDKRATKTSDSEKDAISVGKHAQLSEDVEEADAPTRRRSRVSSGAIQIPKDMLRQMMRRSHPEGEEEEQEDTDLVVLSSAEFNAELQRRDDEIAELQELLAEAETTVRDMAEECQRLKDLRTDESEAYDSLVSENRTLQAMNESRSKDILLKDEEIAALRSALEEERNRHENSGASGAPSITAAEVDLLQKKLQNAEKEVATEREKLRQAEEMFEKANEEIQGKIAEQMGSLNSENEELRTEILQLQEILDQHVELLQYKEDQIESSKLIMEAKGISLTEEEEKQLFGQPPGLEGDIAED